MACVSNFRSTKGIRGVLGSIYRASLRALAVPGLWLVVLYDHPTLGIAVAATVATIGD
jgi:hypothetical protein